MGRSIVLWCHLFELLPELSVSFSKVIRPVAITQRIAFAIIFRTSCESQRLRSGIFWPTRSLWIARQVRDTFTSNFPNLEKRLIPKEGFLGIFNVSFLESMMFGAVISID